MRTMYWRDFEDLLVGLPPEWSMLEQNLVMLIDRIDFLMQLTYAEKITDPDDPEVKARHEYNKRRGITPSPFPLIAPVAVRPSEILERDRKFYEELIEYFALPKKERQALDAQARGEDADVAQSKRGSVREWLSMVDGD